MGFSVTLTVTAKFGYQEQYFIVDTNLSSRL